MKTSIPLIEACVEWPRKQLDDLIHIAVVLVWFAIAAAAQAVSPAPDGGYLGGNTAEGQNALLSLTTGTYNTAVGVFSLGSNTESGFNTAIGAGTLLANTADENTAIGAGALLSNTTGRQNTANGAFTLLSNTTGNFNTATGVKALFSNTDGGNDTAIGYFALFSNATGNHNTGIGGSALYSNSTGDDNTALGFDALQGNTSGISNTGVGFVALANNSADNNTAVGAGALQSNTTGSLNVALGDRAGSNLTTGSNNIAIGGGVLGDAGDENTIRIGNGDMAATFIAGIVGATIAGGTPVYIDSAGKLGTITSSKRFKEAIKPMDKASEALLGLKPVTFRYKKEIDPAGICQFGLVAEEVEKINPDLVVRDKEGKVNSVRYDQVNAMLLNEFLKEQKKARQLEATVAQQRDDFETRIAELQKEIESVVAPSKEQDAKIQKVNMKLELDKAAPRTVVND